MNLWNVIYLLLLEWLTSVQPIQFFDNLVAAVNAASQTVMCCISISIIYAHLATAIQK